MQKPIGELVAKLVSKPDKLHSILENFLKHDEFLAKLVNLSKRVNKLKGTPQFQSIQMAVLRSDFMIDTPTDTPKLVEYNTIACSFGILSQKVA